MELDKNGTKEKMLQTAVGRWCSKLQSLVVFNVKRAMDLSLSVVKGLL